MSFVHFRSYDDTYSTNENNYNDRRNDNRNRDKEISENDVLSAQMKHIRMNDRRHPLDYSHFTRSNYSIFYQCILYIIFILYMATITFWITTGDNINTDHDLNLLIQYATSHENINSQLSSSHVQSVKAPLIL